MKVAIIGAGMSGLFLGYHLDRAGIAYTIYEKRPAAGGTWHDNTYPGLHVDVITRSYEFPFARKTWWSRRYAPGTEIRRYLVGFADEAGITPRIRFDTEVTSATYRDGRWDVTDAGGTTETYDVVVAATGFLRVPRLPRLPGMDSFAGTAFHSSAWDHSVPLAGKRIGVVGTGSSGIQIVSEMGNRGHQVRHFVRTPQWIIVKPNPRISMVERLLLRVPALVRYWDWRMSRLRLKTDGTETWRLVPGTDRETMTEQFHRVLREQIPDERLRAKLTPTEPPGCKRIPKSPDYYQVVQRDNVECVFGGIQRVEPEGIVDESGTLHPLDVIVYATGFDTHAYMRPMNVTGPDGVTVDQLWSEGVYSYRGVGLPGMPNFFLLNGPFAPVNSVAVPTCLRDEVGYLLKIFDVIRTTGRALAPTERATKEFCDRIRAALPGTTYSLCDNWYTDQAGTPIIWPFTRQEHADQYAALDIADFDTYPVATSAAAGEAR
ncbi:flavin-containing monooxygenase [Phytohabitans suffuscus]